MMEHAQANPERWAKSEVVGGWTKFGCEMFVESFSSLEEL